MRLSGYKRHDAPARLTDHSRWIRLAPSGSSTSTRFKEVGDDWERERRGPDGAGASRARLRANDRRPCGPPGGHGGAAGGAAGRDRAPADRAAGTTRRPGVREPEADP